jgi:pyruvate,water dikinase
MTNGYSWAAGTLGGTPALASRGFDGGPVGSFDELAAPVPGDREDLLWSNEWSRNFWAGALSPLHYSVRLREFDLNHREWRLVQGLQTAADAPLFKHRGATAYINTEVEAEHARALFPRGWRAAGLATVHPDDRAAVAAERLDPRRFLRALAGMHVLREGAGITTWMPYVRHLLERPLSELDGVPAEVLAGYDDEALVRYANHMVEFFAEVNLTLWYGFYVYAGWAMSALHSMLERWYSGELGVDAIVGDFARGLPRPTKLNREREALWDIGAEIAGSPALRDLFERNEGAAFFTALADEGEEGRALLDRYRDFVAEFGHLGSADRDLYHPRRSEDPGLDYRALKLVLRADPDRSPRELGERQRAARARTVAAVRDSIASGPLGGVRVAAFDRVLAYVEEFWMLRDNQKYGAERVVLAKKRAWTEIGRRVVAGHPDLDGDDYFFLTADECTALLLGRAAAPSLPTTVAARRRDFEAMLADDPPPQYLRGDEPQPEPSAAPAAGGTPAAGTELSAGAMNGGVARGRTRVARHLGDLEHLERGEILVCASTDPGWSAAFLVAGGLVVEGGGALSFAARMSREHDLPAVVLPGATALIAGGAEIEVDGDRLAVVFA